MFQRLDELQSGSLFILTGQAGAGKSHLAASARRSGTLWVLDTEGAAQSLLGKPGIHKHIQVVQTLSLRALMQAIEEIRKRGKPGDAVLLDSISKIFQAMRAYAQQRAGNEIDRKTSISYDEHASVNRNMQVLYTALTTLKQSGFHVVVVGHLARKYRAQDTGLQDVGLRVLADEQITYEADAILLVDRKGDERWITPIVKPPRPTHLKLEKRYPAVLATLYPELTPVAKPRKGEAPSETPTEDDTPGDETASASTNPPKDANEAEQRFFARYADVLGDTSWQAVQRYLGLLLPKPSSVEGWITVAEQVRDKSRGGTAAAA
ncbi:MAG: AAA family ATPase [Oscillochloris sp.]|nr:AAA family ATPase [Oscillochloris sp.]